MKKKVNRWLLQLDFYSKELQSSYLKNYYREEPEGSGREGGGRGDRDGEYM